MFLPQLTIAVKRQLSDSKRIEVEYQHRYLPRWLPSTGDYAEALVKSRLLDPYR